MSFDKIIYRLTDKRIPAATGIGLVGEILERAGFQGQFRNVRSENKRSRKQIDRGAIMTTFIGLLYMGKPDFDVIAEFQNDAAYYQTALHLTKGFPSSATLRQRMDEIGKTQREQLFLSISRSNAWADTFFGAGAALCCLLSFTDSGYTYDESGMWTGYETLKAYKDKDYTVSYKDNINPGTGSVTITGKGNFTGTVTKTFTIHSPTKSLRLSEHSLRLGLGETRKLRAVTDPVENGQDLYWNYWSFGDKDVATVNSDGLVKGISLGDGLIAVYTQDGWSDNCDVTVLPAPKSVSLNKTQKTIGVGETYSLKATLPSGTASALTWTSSNSSVVSVSSGRLTAKKAGTATITVKTFNGKTATCKMTVKAAPASVTLNKTKKTIGVGETYSLKATLPENTASGIMTWTTSNNAVVTVKDGKLTAKKAGTATITVKTFNGKTASCRVTVK